MKLKGEIVACPPIHDFSVFLGFTSCSFANYEEHIRNIKRLFEARRSELLKRIDYQVKVSGSKAIVKDRNSAEETQLAPSLYSIRMWEIFGEFDLLITTTIEGFALGSRLNTAINFIIDNNQSLDESIDFEFPKNTYLNQNSIGATYKKSNDANLNSVGQTLGITNEDPAFVLIGVQQVKINDLALMEYGNDLIIAIVEKIKVVLKGGSESGKLDFLILQRSNWGELNVLFFANEYSIIADYTERLNNLKIGQLNNLKPNSDLQLFDLFPNTDIGEDCLNNSPVFVKSNTILGYDQAIVHNEHLFNKIKDDECKIYPVTHWMVTSSEASAVKNEINYVLEAFASSYKNEKLDERGIFKYVPKHFSTYGRDDLTTYYHETSTKDFIAWQRFLINQLSTPAKENKERYKELRGIIENSYTVISKDRPEEQLIRDYELITVKELKKYKDLSLAVKKILAFKTSDFVELKTRLKNLLIPHQFKDSILRVYTNYQNNLLDEVMFSRFIELHPILESLYNEITNIDNHVRGINSSKYHEENVLLLVDKLYSELNNLVDGFHYSLHNKQSSAYTTRELYDTNVFHSHAVQDKVSALDFLYKSACFVLGNEKSFIYVESAEKFEIGSSYLLINKSQLYMPELLACMYIQEINNQLVDKFLVRNENKNLFVFHEKYSLFADDGLLKNAHQNIASALLEVELRKGNIPKFYSRNVKVHAIKKRRQGSNVFQNLKNLNNYKQKITPIFLEHVFNDIVNYKVMYSNLSHEEYRYWYWMALFTVSSNFEYDQDPVSDVDENRSEYVFKKSELERSLLRYFITLKALDVSEEQKIKDKNFILKSIKFSVKNFHIFENTFEFIDYYFDQQSTFSRWLQSVNDFIENDWGVDEKEPGIFSILKEIGKDKLNQFSKDFSHNDSISCELPTEISKKKAFFIKALVLSQAFLKSMYQASLKNVEDIDDVNIMVSVQPRKVATKYDPLNYAYKLGANTNILADPAGGVSILDGDIRREAFMYRNLYYRYLFDLTCKFKGDYVKDLGVEKDE